MIKNVQNSSLCPGQKGMSPARHAIHLNSKILRDGDLSFTNSKVMKTDFVFMIRYKATGIRKAEKFPFIINADVLPKGAIRVKNFSDLKARAKDVEGVAWLLRWTNLSPELFLVARYNSYLRVPIQFKYLEYVYHLLNQTEDGDIRRPLFIDTIMGKEIYKNNCKEHPEKVTLKGEDI